MKLMGLDLGTRRIGIAMADELQILAYSFQNYDCQNKEKDLNHILSLIEQYNIEGVVLGLPLNMDGTEAEMTHKVKMFAKRLKRKTSAKIIFEDERLTSIEAEQILDANHVNRKKQRKMLDAVSAQIILQKYLDKKEKLWKKKEIQLKHY